MSQYPSGFDTDVEIPRIEDNITESGAETINAIRSAIFALQRALGIDPQGSANDLTTRLSQSLNDDGTLKTAALILTGIVNSDVASNAAIVESKLDLDVATQYLQDQVVSNDIDIAELQQSIALIISNFARHVAGSAFNHDSFDIYLDSVYPLATPPSFVDLAATNVGDALIEMNDRFLDHADSSTVGAHRATNISVDGANFRTIPVNVDDVQEALEELDSARAVELIKHRDHLHANGFDNWANNLDGYNEYLQLVPATYGDSVVAQIVAGTTNQIRFDGLNLSALGVDQGSVVVILNGDGAGHYIIDDVGPRDGIGIRPSLNQDEVELTLPVSNAELIVDGYVETQVFGQSSVFTFKSNVSATFHQSSATLDSIQLSRPNSAKVITLGLKTHLIDNTHQLDIEVGVGPGLTRTISLTGLDEDRSGPVSTITVDTIVDRINSLFQGSNVFPASAYRVGDELCLAHNWDESREHYIKISNSSAATVLGFDGYGADVLDKEVRPTHMSKFYINGYEHTEFAEILEDTAVASGTTITLDTVNPAAAGVKVGHLLHITNHATTAEMGTYFITAVSSTAVTVHDTVVGGAIDVRIIHDAVPLHELANTTDSLVVQAFLDSAAQVHYNIRSSYDKTITNLDVIDISDNFLAGGYSLESATTTGGHLLQLDAGIEVFVPTGFTGQKIVYGDSNVEWIAVNVVGALGTGTAEVIINKHIDEEEILEVCSVMTNGLETLFHVRDKRLFGSIGQDELREDVVQNYIENPLVELRSNGVVKGFDIINPNEVDPVYPTFEGVLLRGGTAYVDGVRNDVRTTTVVMPDTAGTFYICLNRLGTYVIINDADFTLGDIIDGHAGSILPIVEVVHSGTAITSAIDRRFFINNLDAKVDIIADLTNHMIGSFASFEAAIAFANAYTADEKFFIRITSHTADPITIPLASRDLTLEIDGYVGTVYAYSSCKIRSRGIVGRTQAHIAQGIFVYDDTTHIEFENLNVEGSVSIDSVTTLNLRAVNCSFADTFNFTNSSAGIVQFSDCAFYSDITSDSTNGAITFTNCVFDGSAITPGSLSMDFRFNDGALITGSIFKNATILTEESVRITGSTFIGFIDESFVSVGVGSTVSISNCLFADSIFTETSLSAIASSGALTLLGCTFKDITIPNQMRLIYGNSDTIVSDCLFSGMTWASAATELISVGSFLNNKAISSTGEVNVKAGEIFSYNNGFHQITVGSSNQTQIISGNSFPTTTAFGSSVLFETASISQAIVSDNTFDIASNGIGIQYSASNDNIKINGNHFVGAGGSSIAISLFSGGPSIISGNTFQACTAFENSAALTDSIISNNFADGYQISITIGDNFQFSNNQFDGYVDLSGVSIEGVLISGNILPGGLNIGAELSRSSILNNYVGPDLVSAVRYDDTIIQLSASLYDSVISGNHGIFSAQTSITFDGVVFSENVGGLQASTSPDLEWKDCIISKNKFLQQSNDELDVFTLNIYSDISNNPANVLISENDFAPTVIHLTASNTISHCSFVGNRKVNSAVAGASTLNIQASANYCMFSDNLEIILQAASVSIDNSSISDNVSTDGSLTIAGCVINNSVISNNVCNTITVTGESSDGLTITNNICYNQLLFATFGSNDFVGSSVIGNQCPELYIGNNTLGAVTNSIVGCKFDANVCNDLIVDGYAIATTVVVFSENIVSNNRISNELTLLSDAAGATYENASNQVYNNQITNNNVSSHIDINGGGSGIGGNITLAGLVISGNRSGAALLIGGGASLTNCLISNNYITDTSGVAGVLINLSGAADFEAHDITISNNFLSSSSGTGVRFAIYDGISGSTNFKNWSVSANIMPNMNVIIESTTVVAANFEIFTVSVIGNLMRTFHFANTPGVSSSVSLRSLIVSNNIFDGDAAGALVHTGVTYERGIDITNVGGSSVVLENCVFSNNSAASILAPFECVIHTGVGAGILATNIAINNNTSIDTYLINVSGAVTLEVEGLIVTGNHGNFYAGDILVTTGTLNKLFLANNYFDDCELPSIDSVNDCKIFANYANAWTTGASAPAFTTNGDVACFPWGNTGGAFTSVNFTGTTARTITSTNGTTITT